MQLSERIGSLRVNKYKNSGLNFLKNILYMRTIPLKSYKILENKKYGLHAITCFTLFMDAFCHRHVKNLLKEPGEGCERLRIQLYTMAVDLRLLCCKIKVMVFVGDWQTQIIFAHRNQYHAQIFKYMQCYLLVHYQHR